MNDTKRRDSLYEALAWSALFLWMGIASVIPSLPGGAGLLGIGVILVGLNVARRISGIPVNRFTAILGGVAVAIGGAIFVGRQWFSMPAWDLGFFPTLFLGLGIVTLAYTVARWSLPVRREETQE